ncbi:Hypothetical protein Bdt_0576 [Bdellovibrio bacteriovorus str. Tiberius]|uniref:Uncharacterized protein n=1 Tax=Bdellovibrio bacteriovorus str. Tiberius TaxID=1069642 RepID=K7Z7J0_BDEBC|nr:Hypothetical protein Bdt_0576 [Bdellovibrio bacteriovorus str. Tiberius]
MPWMSDQTTVKATAISLIYSSADFPQIITRCAHEVLHGFT